MPSPGDFGLTVIPGIGGKLIWLGQALIGSKSRYSHAFIVLDDGTIAQAEPGGAKIYPGDYYDARQTTYSHLPLTDDQRRDIVMAARQRIGTPYSWLDYLAIGLHRWGIPSERLRRYVASTHHEICSQYVDTCYLIAGVDLFTGWQAGDVTPGDLARVVGAG